MILITVVLHVLFYRSNCGISVYGLITSSAVKMIYNEICTYVQDVSLASICFCLFAKQMVSRLDNFVGVKKTQMYLFC